YMQTDLDAPNERIIVADLKNPGRSNWREVIPTSKEAVISGYSLAGGKLFVNYLQNVSSRVKVYEPDGKYLREISFPAIGTVGSVSGSWKSNEAFFVYSSFHIPTTVYRYDIA